MKIVIVGGAGTIGKAVVEALKPRHSIITIGHSKGDIQVDMTNLGSIDEMYKRVGAFDALIATAGTVHFGDFHKMMTDEYMIGINSKLMGQVNLVYKGLQYIQSNGSFTLTSGILSDDPIRYGCSASMVCSALNGFVRGAAIEMQRGIRINIVSPTIVTESLDQYGDYFRGYESIPAKHVALAYCKSVEGAQTGQIYKVGW